MKEARGFTLIELLVVMAIIALLSTVVIASLSSARAKARDSKRIADIKSIQFALALYYTDHNMYPRNIYAAAGAAPAGGLAPTYLPVVPRDPNQSAACTTGTQASCYRYNALSTGVAGCDGSNSIPSRYKIGTILEDTAHSILSQDIDTPLVGSSRGPISLTSYNACIGGSGDFDGYTCTGTGGSAESAGCYDMMP